MLFFVIFLALLLRRQSQEVANNKLEQLEAVFLLICDQESCVRLQCANVLAIFRDSLDYYDQVFKCFAATKRFDDDFESMHMEA